MNRKKLNKPLLEKLINLHLASPLIGLAKCDSNYQNYKNNHTFYNTLTTKLTSVGKGYQQFHIFSDNTSQIFSRILYVCEQKNQDTGKDKEQNMRYLSAVFGKNPAEEDICKQSSKGDKTLRLFGRVQSKEYSQRHQDENKQNPENNGIKSIYIFYQT